MSFSSEVVGWLGAAMGGVWIFYKEIYKKQIEARLDKSKAVTESQIERQKNKDILEGESQKMTLEAYTKLNEKVFDLFQNHLSTMDRDLGELKSDIRTISNFCDGFDRSLDEITNKHIKLEGVLSNLLAQSNKKSDISEN